MTETRTEERLARLEMDMGSVVARLARLEQAVQLPEAPARAYAPPAASRPAPAPAPAPAEPRPRPRPAVDLEDLLGGRVLAWAGAVAVLLGLAFFVAVAIGRGWIDEPTRIALAFAASTALLLGGVWLHERRGRTHASRAMVGCGVAAEYLTLTAAEQLYDLFPAALALAAALAVGALATAIAVRWDARPIAALGIVGALLAPVLVGADPAAGTTAFVLIAFGSGVGVLVWRRWDWLALGAFAVAAPQVFAWAVEPLAPAAVVAGLGAFWLLTLGAALGYELRVPASELRASSSLLVIAGGLVTAAAGYTALRDVAHAGDLWIAALAIAHVAAGIAAARAPRVNRDVGVLMVVSGLALGDTAYGLMASGPALAIGWAASAAGLAVFARRHAADADVARIALGAQLCLSILHVLLFEAQPGAVVEGSASVGALTALGALAASAFVCARLTSGLVQLERTFDVVAMVALAYLSAVALDGPALAVAWAAQAVALARAARHGDAEPQALGGAAAFLALAGMHALAFEAPPTALVDGVDDLGAAAVSVGAFGLAFLACARSVPDGAARLRPGLGIGGAAALVYLASVAIVDAFQPGVVAYDPAIAGLGVRQQGQVLLSALWTLCGVAGLVWGLLRDERPTRLAGFALLGLAAGKVFLYDLSTLDSIYRVLSFVGLGLLLLAAAYAYQRMRPRAPGTDLREAAA